ncbi:MAG: Gldg family protein [Alphaproteobacteria bacterium]|nr:Gldg family protein [Alphaproteobacteria bacterium]
MTHFRYLQIAVVAALILAGVGGGIQIDATEKKLYTLSPTTVRVVEGIDEPLSLRFYVSEELVRQVPSYAQYQQRVTDLLEKIARTSNGQFSSETIIADSFSSEEDDALAAGLTPIPLSPGIDVFFGLALSRVNAAPEDNTASEAANFDQAFDQDSADTAVIAVLNPGREQYLEYDLLNLIQDLNTGERPKVGILTSEFPFGTPSFANSFGQSAPSGPWAIIEQVESIAQIDLVFAPEDLERLNPKALILLHPEPLSPRMQFAIEQYAFRGGKLLIFADPHYDSFAPSQYAPEASDASSLQGLPASWKVQLRPDVAAADPSLALGVSYQRNGRNEVATHLSWVRTADENYPSSSVVTGSASDVIFASPGVVEVLPGSPFALEPLVVMSPEGGTVPLTGLEGSPPDLFALSGMFEPSQEPITIAGLLTGSPTTAFPNGAPPPAEGEAQPAPSPEGTDATSDPEEQTAALYAEPLAEPVVPITLLVVADVDFLRDRFWVQRSNFLNQTQLIPTAENGALFLAMVESLAGAEGLADLQLRGISNYPFTHLNDLRRDAEQQFQGREQELEQRVQELLQQLENRNPASAPADGQPTNDATQTNDEALVAQIREELVTTRSELRAVNRQLNEDVESVERTVTWVNTLVMPLVVILVYIGWRRRSTRRLRQGISHAR